MAKDKYNIAVVGATGAVGVEILRVLERRNFPVGRLTLLASANSAGKWLDFGDGRYQVQAVTDESFAGIDFAFFSAGAGVSRTFVPYARKAGAKVIDNTSAYRTDPAVPLVVPEINGHLLDKDGTLFANPNCTAAILGMAVWPIHKVVPVKKITVATYQSASGAGAKAMRELEDQMRQYAAGEEITRTVFPHQIALNVFSHNTEVGEDGLNDEERKVIRETRKMFGLGENEIAISPTCVRVPVLRAHTEAVTLDLGGPMTADEARKILSDAPGVKIVDDRRANHFPMPIEASGDLDVHVGRIRQEPGNPKGIQLIVAGDQLLKGAAWNAVQIAEELAKL